MGGLQSLEADSEAASPGHQIAVQTAEDGRPTAAAALSALDTDHGHQGLLDRLLPPRDLAREDCLHLRPGARFPTCSVSEGSGWQSISQGEPSAGGWEDEFLSGFHLGRQNSIWRKFKRHGVRGCKAIPSEFKKEGNCKDHGRQISIKWTTCFCSIEIIYRPKDVSWKRIIMWTNL